MIKVSKVAWNVSEKELNLVELEMVAINIDDNLVSLLNEKDDDCVVVDIVVAVVVVVCLFVCRSACQMAVESAGCPKFSKASDFGWKGGGGGGGKL